MNEQPAKGSRLFYFGTTTEVMLGDRVRMRRWLFRDRAGVVCYVPGLSEPHPDLEVAEADFKDWAIRLDDGAILTMLYAPDSVQPLKKIVFLGRGRAESLPPDVRLT